MINKLSAFIVILMLSQFAVASQSQSYLVTWDPLTVSSRDEFYKHLPAQASSLLELWQTKKVENVYLDPKQVDLKGGELPTVMFVLQADGEEAANKLLAQMPYVQHNVIQYNLTPVGNFWLGKYDPALFNRDTSDKKNITLINTFEVPKGQEQAAIKHWEKARDFLQTQPGYISTKLHQTIQPDARFQLINIAQWESKESFSQAISKMNQELKPSDIDGLKFYPALYKDIRS